MNLKEAIESGKRFKRNYLCEWGLSNEKRIYSHAEVLADDWEVEEPRVRLEAWICLKEWGAWKPGEVMMYDHSLGNVNTPFFKRAPWLDEPEEE